MQEVMRRPRRVILVFGLILSLGGAALWWTGVQAQDAPPPAPIVYSGAVTVGGSPAPDGLTLVARIADHETEPVTTQGGRYEFLKVTGPADYLFRPVTFHLKDYDVQAAEIVQSFTGGPAFVDNFNLSFLALPSLTPTPTPAYGNPDAYGNDTTDRAEHESGLEPDIPPLPASRPQHQLGAALDAPGQCGRDL